MSSSTTRAWLPVCMVMVLALGLPACGGSDSPSQPDDVTDDDPAGTNAVSVVDNSFDPDAVQVDPGETVTWSWQGSNQHNVTWTSAELADSPTQGNGSSHSVTMPSESGGYDYYCTIHGTPNSGMRGTVEVE